MASVLRKGLVLAVSIGAGLILAACGGGEDEAAPTAQNPPSSPPPAGSNQAPTISGTPPTQILVGQQYTFTPTASDADGDTLTFTLVNPLPAWATFSTSTGQLSGAPGVGDVGTYSNIQIRVSDGTTSVNLPSFSVAVVAMTTGQATLSWNPPTQNTDGSPAMLTGYKVYWGTAQGSYSNSAQIDNPGIATYVVDQLTPATWYFVVTALSASGESGYSNIGQKIVR
jgi:hypothetical protein